MLGLVLPDFSRLVRSFDNVRRAKRSIRVEHVRYVNEPARDAIRAKARDMCERMGKPVPEVLLP